MAESFTLTGPLAGERLSCIRGSRVLFEGLSFKAAPGTGLVILGPNGSGKTSLLRILAGFLAPDNGTLSFDGEEAGHGHKLIPGQAHYLGHAHALKPFLSVRENLSFWARLLGDGAWIEAACKKTGVLGLLDLPVKFLSEGQKKRVNLARFLISPLPLWLMDEPAAGLDKDGQAILKTLIEGHLKAGGIFVGATHQDLALKGVQTITLEGRT